MSPSSRAAQRAAGKSSTSADPDSASADATTVLLPDRLDFAATRDLHARLLELRGGPVILDGTAVVFGGALAAQVLVGATRDWAAAGDMLSLKLSPSLQDDLRRLAVLGEFPNLVEVE
ncbi:MAG TPA: hypothetical protein VK146_15630 [Tabrizicola sp.]|nr:hypothetical protein [Tabrizicola sp.]